MWATCLCYWTSTFFVEMLSFVFMLYFFSGSFAIIPHLFHVDTFQSSFSLLAVNASNCPSLTMQHFFFFKANSWSGRFLTKNFILWPLFYVWLSIFKKKKKKNLTCCHLFITIYWSLRKNSVCGCLAMSSVFWITFLDTVLFTPLNFLQIISF